jgi:hypothetical protein
MNLRLTSSPGLQLIFLLALSVATGCRERESTVSAGKEPVSVAMENREDFAERLNAAMSIVDLNKRDDALTAVANAAAAAGQADVTRQALGRTVDINKRDAAAESCALALAKADKRAEANAVARQILDLTRRDRTLAKLAIE